MYRKIIPLAAAVAIVGAPTAIVNAQARTPNDVSADSSAPTKAGNTNTAQYSKTMRRLQGAAQRLRDATQAMAEQKATRARREAIKQTNEALLDTRRAMLELAFELQYASPSSPDYQKAMDRLKQAAQKLRDATHAMAGQPAGQGRNAAIRQTNEALLETQQAMLDLIPDVPDARQSTTGTGAKQSN